MLVLLSDLAILSQLLLIFQDLKLLVVQRDQIDYLVEPLYDVDPNDLLLALFIIKFFEILG
jgi:hypothetical protein